MPNKNISLRTSVGGIDFPTCIYNASGPRSGTSTALAKVYQSNAGGVLAKSATIEKQNGNPQPRTYHTSNKLASFNSEGLPNNGIDYYISAETIQDAMAGNNSSKPYMVSISGKTLQDNLEMLQRIIKASTLSQIKAVELNLACPNVIGKPIIAYDFEQMNDILKQVCNVLKDTPSLVLGIKLPPYLDGPHFQTCADIVNQYKDQIKYVATINTIGNAFVIDMNSEAPVISSNNGFAGLSGPAVKYTALANVRKLRLALDSSIDIVGVGGVTTGQDVFEFILCGASAVQIGTCHWIEGPACFDRICQELTDIMQSKGYTSIKDFQGKLKDWSREGAALAREAAKQQQQGGEAGGKTTTSASGTDPIILGFLIALIAILLADKFAEESFLPF